jgi:hypothetical protein
MLFPVSAVNLCKPTYICVLVKYLIVLGILGKCCSGLGRGERNEFEWVLGSHFSQ